MSRPVTKHRRQRVAASPAAAGFRPASAAWAVAAAFTMPTFVLAQPTGASVVQGQASFARSGNNLVVTTTNAAGTNQSAINWQSFSVPTGSTTQFNQPTTTSTSINRVLGSDPSSIFGTLSSNGRLVLVNPNGIAVGKGAVVDTAAFTASTLKLSDADLAAGRMAFGGNAGGVLQVDGRVIARQGDVILIAPNVQTGESALVQAPNGATVLAAGQKVEVTGRGLEGITFEVQAGNQAVNLGTLQGNAVGIFAGTLKHSGAIAATAVTGEGGKVILKAAGDNLVSGSIRATAQGDKGGSIDVLGERVGIMAGAVVDASGANGGGQVRIGGDYQGKNADVQNALRTYVDALASIRADATKQGDGGRVIVWSDEATRMHGKISARGGAEGGNGGFVEVSGKQYLEFTGQADLRAPQGDAGKLLLDPNDIQIAAAPASTDTTTDYTVGPPFVFAGGGPVSTIQDSTLSGQLALGNVEVRTDMGTSSGPQGGQISLLSGANVSWVAPTALWLRADAGIDLQGNITGSSGSSALHLTALGGSVLQSTGSINVGSVLAAAVGSVQLLGNNAVGVIAGTAGADFQLANGGTAITVGSVTTPWGNASGITTTAGGVNLTTASDINLQGPVTAPAYNVFLNSTSGNITQTSGVITAAGLLVDAGGGASLTGANMIDTLSGWTGASFDAVNAKALTIGSVDVSSFAAGGNHGATGSGISATGPLHVSTTAGDLNTTNSVYGSSITLGASGGLANVIIDQSVSSSSGPVEVTAASDVTIGAGYVSASGGSATLTASRDVSIGSGGVSTLGGPVAVSAGRDVWIGGYVSSSGSSVDMSGGNNVTIVGYQNLSGNGITLTATGGSVDLNSAYLSSNGPPIVVSALAGGILGTASLYVNNATGGSIQMTSGPGGVSFGSFSAYNGGTVTVSTTGGVSGYTITTDGANGSGTKAAGGGGLISVTAGSGSVVNLSYLSATGGYGYSGTGATGGTVSVSAGAGSSLALYSVNASGGSGDNGGGAGGTINVSGGSIGSNYVLMANGGNANYSGTGGVGGMVSATGDSMALTNVHAKGGDGGGGGGAGGLITLGAPGGSINLTGMLSAIGGYSSAGTGGGGGTIHTSSGSLTADQIYAYGGGSNGAGADGGEVSISASGGGQAVTLNGIVADASGGGVGGIGGTVTVATPGGGMAIGSISVNGGGASGLAGDGGNVLLTGQDLIQVGSVSAVGGISSFGSAPGGLGGAIKITSTQGDITIVDWLDASGGPGGPAGRAQNVLDDGRHAIELLALNGTATFPTLYASGGYGVSSGDGAKGGSVHVDAKNISSIGDYLGISIYGDGGDGNAAAGSGGSVLLTGGSGGGTFTVGKLSAIGGYFSGTGAPGGTVSISAPTTDVSMAVPEVYSPGTGGTNGHYDVTARSISIAEPGQNELKIENATLATTSGNLDLLAVNGGSVAIRNSTLSTSSGTITAQGGSSGNPSVWADGLHVEDSTVNAGGGSANLSGFGAAYNYGATVTGNVQLNGTVFIGGVGMPANASPSYNAASGGLSLSGATISGSGALTLSGSAACGCAVLVDTTTFNRTGGDLIFAANGIAGPDGHVEITDTLASTAGGNVSLLAYGGGKVSMATSSFGTGGGAVVMNAQGGIELVTSTLDTTGGGITMTGGTLAGSGPGINIAGNSSVHAGTGAVNIQGLSGTGPGFVLTSAAPPALSVSGADVVITGTSATPGGQAVLISGETVTSTNSMTVLATGGELRVENSSTVTNSGPGPMQLISQYTSPAPPPPSPATSLNVTAGSSITNTGSGDVQLVADQMDISGTLTAAGRVVIAPTTSTRPISYGGAPDPNKLVLSTATLANISAGSVVLGSGASNGGLSIDGNIGGAGQTISLINAGPITQSVGTTITAQNLNVDGGSVVLTNVDVGSTTGGQLSGRSHAGPFKINNQQTSPATLTIGTVDGINGIIATGGDVAVSTPAGLGIAQQVSSDATGTAVVLSGTTLNNTFGSGAIATPGGGRWLVYLSDVNGNTFGGLASGQLALWGKSTTGYPPASVVEPGNRYLFATTPTVNVTANAATRVYDATATAPALTFTQTGLVDAASFGNVFLQDTFTGTLAAPTLTGKGNVGSYAITQGTLTQPTGYNMGTFTGASLTITQLALGLSGTSINSKIYDGTTAATVAAPGTLAGVIAGDTVGVAGGSGVFADRNVGTGKTVTVSGVTLTGADAGNYMIGSIAPTTGTITPKAVTLTGASANSRTYDATTAATLATAGTLAGTIGGDAVSVGSTTASFADKNVGTSKPVTVNATLVGGDAGNYSFLAPTGITANITPFALGVTGLAAANKVYNANTAATISGSVTLAGVFAGDTVSSSGGTTGSFADKNVGNAKPVSVSTITLSGTDAANYTVVAPTLSANITPASLGVTGLAGVSRAYDATTNASISGTPTLTGVLGGDTVSVSGGSTGFFADKNVGTGKAVSVAGLTLGGIDAGNYLVVPPTGLTANITPASLTVGGLTAASRTYDGTTLAALSGSATLGGVFAGDTVTVSGGSGTFANKNVGTAKTVSVTGLALSGTDALNYSLVPTSLTADIFAATLGVTGLTANSRVYNATTTATVGGTLSLTGVVAGDSVSTSVSSAVFADKNVGTGKVVAVTLFPLSGADAGNYTVIAPTLSANITPASLSVTGLSGVSRTYNATVDATVTGTPTLSGLFAGDSVAVSGGTMGVFANKNVGTGKAISVTDLVIGGTDANNYSLLPTTVTANITPASLTVGGLNAVSRAYNGTTLASLSGSATLGGVFIGDSVTASGGTGAFADKNVGSLKPVTVTGVTLSGLDAANYSVLQPTGLSANITPASLTVSGLTAANKVYDTTTSATLNGTATLGGVVSGDNVTVSGGSGAFANKNVGTGKVVTVSGLVLGGTDAVNYSLTAPTGITANITPVSLTASGLTAQNKVYDGTTLATLSGSATLTGVLGSDNVTVSGGSGTFANKNVGTAKTVTITGATLGGADAGNYTLTASGTTTANITAKALSVTGLTASNKVYDATTTATLNGTAALSGVVTGDTVTVSGGTGAFNNKNVGSAKPVLVNGFTLAGTDAGNYTVSGPTNVVADITQASVSVSGLTAQNKVYDGTTIAALSGSATLTGVIAGDSVSATGAVGAFADKNVGSAKPVTVSGATLVGADAGNYKVTTPTPLAADITPATLTLSGLGAASKVYDGTTTATLSGSAGLAGLVTGDAVSITGGTGQFNDKNVGTAKPVAVTGVTVGGADAGNYKLVVPSALTANITPATLTAPGLQATDKTYDATTGATLGGSTALSGVVTGDTVAIASTSATFNNKNVGTAKPVTVNGITLSGADSGNYTVSLPAGLTASITPATLTAGGVTAVDKVYDATSGATVTGTLTLTGVFAGDQVSGTPGLTTFADRNAATNKPVTMFSVDLAGADAGNYKVIPPSGLQASITPAPLTIRANDQVKNEGSDFTFTGTEFTTTGLIGVERISTVTLSSTGAPAPAAAGDYAISAAAPVGTAGFLASNYTTTFQSGKLTVSASPVTQAPAPAQQQVQNLVVSFAQLFVEEAKVQPPADGGSNDGKDKDAKKAGKDDVVITDTSCK